MVNLEFNIQSSADFVYKNTREENLSGLGFEPKFLR